jgi:hypothetical protein
MFKTFNTFFLILYMQTFNSSTEVVANINGYLESIAVLNSYADDCKTYYVVLLNKINKSYEETLRKHFNVKSWKVTSFKLIDDWRVILKTSLQNYFSQKQYLLNNTYGKLDILQENLFKKLELVIANNYEFYSVKVDWNLPEGEYEGFYECYQNDYLFDLGNEILFLHFGSSD